MKAAKAPPSPELVREASVAADVIALWASGDRKKLDTTIVGDGDASEFGFCARIVRLSVAEFLRNHPERRSPRGEPYQMRPAKDSSGDEWEVCCLFCGHDINTLVASRQAPRRFWETIEKHAWLCAAQYLAGMTTEALDARTPAQGERVVAISKLRGRQLFHEAQRAAQYLGLPVPRYYRGKRRTPVLLQRQMVKSARSVAKQRSLGVPDDSIAELVAVAEWKKAG